MKNKYVICGCTFTSNREDIMPVLGITNSYGGDETNCYFDNSPYDIKACYGMPFEIKPIITETENHLNEIRDMLLNQTRGEAEAILLSENGLIIVKDWEYFTYQVQPLRGFTGEEPTVHDMVDFVEFDGCAEEYDAVMEFIASVF